MSDKPDPTTSARRLTTSVRRWRLHQQMQQTRRAVAARDRAVQIVSHDLGNPLSTIEICAAALLDPNPPPTDGTREMAYIIQRSAAWMRRMVQDVLDRASLDAGRLTLERRSTPVADVLEAIRMIFAPAAHEQGLMLVVDGAVDLPDVDADPNRLMQILSNLLSNAVKFTPSGGQVTVSADRVDCDLVRFMVCDTGSGIPPQDLVHVFDWFWQSRRGQRPGTGLGLAIARGLVEAHDGCLDVHSVPGGTTFWFSLPVWSQCGHNV